jgi:hypothetical protein
MDRAYPGHRFAFARAAATFDRRQIHRNIHLLVFVIFKHRVVGLVTAVFGLWYI